MTQKFHIKTYGCQMNVYDTDAMAQILLSEGWQKAEEPSAAEVIILNSCHIREKAAQKIYSDVGRFKLTKKKDAVIAVAGCVAQAEGQAMMTRQKEIGLVFGPQDFHRLPAMIASAQKGERPLATDFLTHEKFSKLKQSSPANVKTSSFLTIQEGCDKFCSFCVVPYTRGLEVSRAAKDVILEAEKLLAAGATEIILLGQNVNAYHHQGWDLADLLEALAELAGVKRLRYTTSHPLDMSEKLICAHRDNVKLMPSLHLPVQSGADRILKKMNRRHSTKDYLDIITALRAARSDIALSSDFIVGFPGESDEDFADTLSLVEKVNYAAAYSFKYSPRAGTKAADEIQVDEGVKSQRLAQLQKLLASQQATFHHSKTAQVLEVLAENNSFGKTPYNQNTYFNVAGDVVGQLLQVKVIRATPHGVEGEVL